MRVDQDRLRRERDPLLVAVVTVVAVLAVGLGGWLLAGVLTHTPPDRVAVEIDNRTGLTLSVEAVDAAGTKLALGRIPPGTSSTRHELPVPSSEWTFVASYGDREVWRSQPVSPSVLARGSHGIRIEPTREIRELEEQGFR